MQWRANWNGNATSNAGEGVVAGFIKGIGSTKVIIVLADGRLTEMDQWQVRLTPITDADVLRMHAIRIAQKALDLDEPLG